MRFLTDDWSFFLITLGIVAVPVSILGAVFWSPTGPGARWVFRLIARRRAARAQVLRRVETGNGEQAWVDQ